MSASEKTFWEHLEDLRWVIIRSLVAWLLAACLVFTQKELLTSIVFAPHDSNFVIYRLLCELAEKVHFAAICPPPFTVELLNTRLAAPFFTHITTSFYAGIVVAFPYLIFQLWKFIAPALYAHEKRRTFVFLICGILLFACGILLAYYLIFPIAFRFLGTYAFGSDVVNRIDLQSYMSTFYTTILAVGLVFQMPILAYFLAKIGIVKAKHLRQYHRHAVVVILLVAAIVTPTADPFTLMLLGIPMYFLYLLSIRVAQYAERRSVL
ncbi:Sec-independent protein translocase protein TatC [Bacteroidia bacterium]|nr:Sec-independent protein translocase protein TatC [Bacteroidia bacterium]